jgi:ethanolamine utilization microcompartment shell protein EutS
VNPLAGVFAAPAGELRTKVELHRGEGVSQILRVANGASAVVQTQLAKKSEDLPRAGKIRSGVAY